jgi:hypothetical protein
MYAIELVCSNEACAEISEVTVLSLEEIDVLVCDGCGCTLQSLSVSEVVELRAASKPVQLRRAAVPVRRAA